MVLIPEELLQKNSKQVRVTKCYLLNKPSHKAQFPPGVYNYPISFAIPSTSPPSLECKYGSVKWRLKARAHRPGPFTTKMTCTHDLTLVPSPATDPQETGNVVLERFWDMRLQLGVAVSGRHFFIGARVPVTFTLKPLDKVHIYEISVWLEGEAFFRLCRPCILSFIAERVDYYTRMDRIARTEPLRRTQLLLLRGPQLNKDKDKGSEPLLPVFGSEATAFLQSPFSEGLPPQTNLSEVAAAFMGPGPWVFQRDLQLPETCSEVHFTNNNISGNITITHSLKFVVAVDRPDTEKGRKRKCSEITESTQIQIISVSILFTLAMSLGS